jgi:hypothetical protein
MWSPDSPALTQWNGGKIVPKTVLYYYDGPTVFTADVGLTEFLFYKIDEDANSDLFLIAPTNRKIIGALEKRSLSLRGALANSMEFWILDVARDQEVRRYWKLEISDIGEDMLPDNGLALAPLTSPAADFIEQALSFFSTRFTGENLTESSVPFVRFKQIVDAAYDSFRRIFPAPVLENRSLARSLDFGLLQPKFSSLIIAIDRPSIDKTDAKKYIHGQIDEKKFHLAFEKNRTDFFDRMGELLTEAKKGEIKKAYAVEHFYTLDQVNNIVPTTANSIDRVEFRAQAPSLNPVSIDDQLGDKFRQAHKIAERAPRQMTGVVVDINDASGTLVIRGEDARQITCIFERSEYENLSVSTGDKIRVRGIFTRRKRRDLILINAPPQILP